MDAAIDGTEDDDFDEDEVELRNIIVYRESLEMHHQIYAESVQSKPVWLLMHAKRPDRLPGEKTLTSTILHGLPEAAEWPCLPAELTVVGRTGGLVIRHLVSALTVAQHLEEYGHAEALRQCEKRGQLVICGYYAARVADYLGLTKAPRIAHTSRWGVVSRRDKAYQVLALAHLAGGVSASSSGWVVSREAFEELWKRADYIRHETLGPEGRKLKAQQAVKTLGPEGCRLRSEKARTTMGPIGRKRLITKANATLGPEGRRKRALQGIKTLGPEGCRRRAVKANITMGAFGRRQRILKAYITMGLAGRRAKALKANTTLGPDGRQARSQKAMQTLGPDGLRKRAAKTLETLGEEGISRRNVNIAAGHAARPAGEHSDICKHAIAGKGQDWCQKRTAKAMKTMGKEGLKERGKNILKSLGTEGLAKRNKAIGEANKKAAEKKLIANYGSVEAGRAALKEAQRARRRIKARERRAAKRQAIASNNNSNDSAAAPQQEDDDDDDDDNEQQ